MFTGRQLPGTLGQQGFGGMTLLGDQLTAYPDRISVSGRPGLLGLTALGTHFFFEIQNWMVYMLLACTHAFKSSSPNVFRESPVLRYSRPVNRATHVPRGALEICYPQCITRGATDSPSLRNPS